MARPRSAPTRRVAILAFPDVQVLDVTGPLEVFGRTNRLLQDERQRRSSAYDLTLIAKTAGPVRTSSGLQLVATSSLRDVSREIDTLIVAGGPGAENAASEAAILAWLRRMAPRVRRLASVCTGAFVLAAAGLLDGRRATTHWASCDRLARRYPKIAVDPDPIFVRDGRVYTSAGVTSGMDLALALLEEDFGRAVALQVARRLVLFLRRPGGQSQFSAQLTAQLADREPLRELQGWIADHVRADLSVPALAERVAMSPRNFARVFRRELGMSPARFVELSRVEAARRRLEESADAVDAIADSCGFGTGESMRRAFLRAVSVAPSDYRRRFRSTTENK